MEVSGARQKKKRKITKSSLELEVIRYENSSTMYLLLLLYVRVVTVFREAVTSSPENKIVLPFHSQN